MIMTILRRCRRVPADLLLLVVIVLGDLQWRVRTLLIIRVFVLRLFHFLDFPNSSFDMATRVLKKTHDQMCRSIRHDAVFNRRATTALSGSAVAGL